MNKELIERLKLATVAIGYAVPPRKLPHNPKGVPEWIGTGFLAGERKWVITCRHVMEGNKQYRVEGDVRKPLRSYMFRSDPDKCRILGLPVTKWWVIEDLHLESTHFLKDPLDVARLQLDTEEWFKSVDSEGLPSLEVERDFSCDVGEEVVVVGYPSPAYLIAQRSGEPNSLGALFQFGRIAGILPTSTFPLPHLLALDITAVHGSSGSPVVRVSDGKVIGIVTELLPALTTMQTVPQFDDKGHIVGLNIIPYPIPGGVSFALPSNFFAEFATQTEGGKIVNF